MGIKGKKNSKAGNKKREKDSFIHIELGGKAKSKSGIVARKYILYIFEPPG